MTRGVCWVTADVLVVWGGLNTVIGNAVLFGLVHPSGGYDRPDLVGHARLWDPVFLVWGWRWWPVWSPPAVPVGRPPHPSHGRMRDDGA